MSKKIYGGPKIKEKAEDYHGQCAYARISPPNNAKSLSIEVPFEDAVRLSLALQSCLLKLNRLDRKAKQGKSMGVEFSITTENKAIKIIEKKMTTG